jgi:hypothetical protein
MLVLKTGSRKDAQDAKEEKETLLGFVAGNAPWRVRGVYTGFSLR